VDYNAVQGWGGKPFFCLILTVQQAAIYFYQGTFFCQQATIYFQQATIYFYQGTFLF